MSVFTDRRFRKPYPGETPRWNEPSTVDWAIGHLDYIYQVAWSRPTVTARSRHGNEHYSLASLDSALALANSGNIAAAWRILAEQIGDEYAALSHDSATGLGATGSYVRSMWEDYWSDNNISGNMDVVFNEFARRQVISYIAATRARGMLLNEAEIARVYDQTIEDMIADGYPVNNTLIGHAAFAEINRLAQFFDIDLRASFGKALGLGDDRLFTVTDDTLDITDEQFAEILIRIQEAALTPVI